jgi:hypothetical protein
MLKSNSLRASAGSRAAPRAARNVRAFAARPLWAPGVEAPAYLDGTLAGDYGGCATRGPFAIAGGRK